MIEYSKDISTGLIGYPLSHTYSPLIHNSSFELNGLDMYYQLYEIAPEEVCGFLKNLPENIKGLNVTIPHKEKALECLDNISEDVKNTRSVNTIVNQNGKLSGYNTDIEGIKDSLEHYFDKNSLKRFLILGAGATAKTAVYTINKYFGPDKISLVYRNEKRLDILQKLDFFERVEYIDTADKSRKSAALNSDIIINCTPSGMYPNIDAAPLNDEEIAQGAKLFDLIYNPGQTKLMQMVKDKGGIVAGGLRMLIVQAAYSFKLFCFFCSAEMPIDKITSIMEKDLKSKRK